MPQNFIACDREQELLLPPNLREWLPEDHLVWFVLATIEELDLSAFYGAPRGDVQAVPRTSPGMMLAAAVCLLQGTVLFAGDRARARGGRRRPRDRGNQRPDHTTRTSSPASRGGARRSLWSGVGAVCGGWHGEVGLIASMEPRGTRMLRSTRARL